MIPMPDELVGQSEGFDLHRILLILGGMAFVMPFSVAFVYSLAWLVKRVDNELYRRGYRK